MILRIVSAKGIEYVRNIVSNRIEIRPIVFSILKIESKCSKEGLYFSHCTLATVHFVVVLAVSIVYARKERNDVVILSPAPTTAPSLRATSMREMVIREYMAGIVNHKIFDLHTPHYTAVDWIVNKDPMQLEIVDPNLLRRCLWPCCIFNQLTMEPNNGRPATHRLKEKAKIVTL